MGNPDLQSDRSTRTLQTHFLAGPYREVGVGLFELPRSVVTSSWYVLLLDVDERAGVYLFTKADHDDTRVVSHEWTAPSFGDLPIAVFHAALKMGSENDVESVLRSRCEFASSALSLAPVSPRGAFGRPFDSLRGRLARAFVLAR